MKKFLSLSLIFILGNFTTLFAQNSITIQADKPQNKISKYIYGQFSEHLGKGIYGGLWVGKDSDIPNTDGFRNDVVKALKELDIPDLRWIATIKASQFYII